MKIENYLALLRQTRRYLAKQLHLLKMSYISENVTNRSEIEGRIARCFIIEERLEAKISSFDKEV